MYTTTINQNGLVLINKAAREALGLKFGDRVTINFSKKSAVIEKEMSDRDFFRQLDALKSDRTKENIDRLAGKSADELFELSIRKLARDE